MAHKYNPIRLYLDGYDWTGRTTGSQLLLAWVPFVLAVLMDALAPMFPAQQRLFEVAAFLVVGFVFVPAFGHVVRRLNDTNLPAALTFLLFVPYVCWAMVLVLLFRGRKQRRTRYMGILRRAGFALACAGALLGFSRATWEPYVAMASSMNPTLETGDYIAVGRVSSDFDRGDVVAFYRHDGVPLLKRIIGVGGDVISIENGVVVLNGEPSAQEPDGTYIKPMVYEGPNRTLPRCGNGAVGQGADCISNAFTEAFPDENGSHRIVNLVDNGPFDQTPEYRVPQDMFFVMGDNRDNSMDSRVPPQAGGVGLVPQNAIIGKARLIVLSFEGTTLWNPFAIRWGRILKAVE